jgi:hypothetical protein
MRLKRLLCTVSGIGMWISGTSPLQGAGLLPEVCAFTSVVRQGTLRAVGHQQLSAMRHYSTGMFQGKYLQTDDQGSVSLRQSKYPKYSDDEKALKEIREGLLNLMREAELRLGRPLTERERSQYNISHYVLAQKKQAKKEAIAGRPHEKKEFTKLKKGSHYLEQIQR